MLVRDLQTLSYRDAWAIQEEAHAQALAGGEEQILVVEHPPVITLGRRPGQEPHLIASAEMLAERGVEVVQSDRGGDVTFHGPGQVVVYPIIRLADHKLSVGCYVHLLETVVIDLLAEYGIAGYTDKTAIGVWTTHIGRPPAKVCAIGVRIKRGVSMHGLALNVNTDLSYFNLIVPCGLADKSVTSMQQLLGDSVPPIEEVKRRLSDKLRLAIDGFEPQCPAR